MCPQMLWDKSKELSYRSIPVVVVVADLEYHLTWVGENPFEPCWCAEYVACTSHTRRIRAAWASACVFLAQAEAYVTVRTEA